MNGGSAGTAATHDETLFELAQWLARVQQYSASHPACAQLGERTHRALSRSLAIASPLSIDVLKDGMSIEDVAVGHAAVRTRLAPHLHERGVLVLRFLPGATVAELTALIELFTLPVQTTFDRGGLRALASERGLARIQIEEIAHDISADERAAQRTRARLRTSFADVLRELLAKRAIRGLTGAELLELLDHPEIAVTILEEDPLGIAESLAGLCLMVRDEEQATGTELYPKLRVIILALSLPSHDRVLLGLPTLVGDFREALVWALDGLDESELARIALASFRAHATELDVTLYALSVAAPHDGRRLSTLRRVALHFYDLPSEDASASELVTVCAMNAGDVDSYWRERECLAPHAMRILGGRGAFAFSTSAAARDRASGAPPPDYLGDQRRVMSELVKMASRTRRFEQLCAKLPQTAVTFARAGSTESVLGIVDGLRGVTREECKELAKNTLREVVSPAVAGLLLADTDTTSADIEGEKLDDLTTTVRLLTALAPTVVFEQLELSESRKMRRIFIESLVAAGPRLLPLVRRKLHAPSWFVVRNALVILTRIGGTAADLLPVASHPNEKVRLEVLRSLRALPSDAQAMDFVAAYLTDPVQEIRQHSLVLLRGELLSAEGVARLERIAANEQESEDRRRRVVEALGRCPLDAAATALFTLLQPRGLLEIGSLRDVVAVALRGSPAPLGPGYFAEGLKSPAWRVRKACERAAGGGT
ncbi:MAG: HEAT-like repeat-containing protein [Labilithrix sp.]|nr:HEAT-like repeat-containing protein [Labilithrix sp.]